MDRRTSSSPTAAAGESVSALEQFRQQWREEVISRRHRNVNKVESHSRAGQSSESNPKPERLVNKPPGRHPLAEGKDREDDAPAGIELSRSALAEKIEGLHIRDVDADEFSGISTKEPTSALEHYERAVEKESQGNLGDSLSHYRTAFRLDTNVDKTYKNKHFPDKPKPAGASSSDAPVAVANTVRDSSEQPTFADLIRSFGGFQIPNAEPVIEGDIPPPCTIRKLPTEVLVEVLQCVAIQDPAVFVRMALVCRRLAYHVMTEAAIWKRIALGNEFGLASQRYNFATDIQGREAVYRLLGEGGDDQEPPLPPVDETLFPKTTHWRKLFQTHPRIRYSGVYISTVNYTRAGGVSATPGTWNSSVHIVTYYRYLRFFRDGTVISLLTTSEPVDVVHHLTKENLQQVRSGGRDASHPSKATSGVSSSNSREGHILLPSAQNILKPALRGRWRLCHPSLVEQSSGPTIGANTGLAGDLHIETEGVGPRYMYTLHLSIRSGSKSRNVAKNNKLIWKGFWSYNHLTDDWCEFGLKHDKPFWFSRVKSYGLGY